jgi:hypothetical protein
MVENLPSGATHAENEASMILLVVIVAIALIGAGVNLGAAHLLETRPTMQYMRFPSPIVEVDGIRTRLESIPSLADHEARMIEPDAGDDRGWMQTFSGKRFHPLNPRAADIELADVAHGLAMTCRYGGQSRIFYSVAEHCILVSKFVEVHARNAGRSPEQVRNLAQLGLMHDSAEAYIGDMIRPLKHQPEMAEFRRVESKIEQAIAEAFHLQWTPKAHEIIKNIDNRILIDEISYLMADPEMYLHRPWHQEVSPLGAWFRCMPPADAERAFLTRYRELFT